MIGPQKVPGALLSRLSSDCASRGKHAGFRGCREMGISQQTFD